MRSKYHPSARDYALAGIIVALWLIAGTIDAEPVTVNLTAADCATAICPGVTP